MKRVLAALVLVLAFGLVPPDGAPDAEAAQLIRAADPSVIRVGAGTYVSVQSAYGGVAVRQVSSPDGLASAAQRQGWTDTKGRGEVWAPEIVTDGGRFYIYFSA